MAKAKLRFGLLLDSYQLKNWQWACVQNILREKQAELVLVVLNQKGSSYSSKRVSLGFRYLDRLARKLPLFQEIALEEQLKSVDTLAIQSTFTATELEKLASYKLDFCLRFGFGIIKGPVLSVPRHGIWSFHHGNPSKFRGGPPLFWEMMKSEYTQGFILQRLSEKLDAGVVLLQGEIPIKSHSYQETLSDAYELSTLFPAKLCAQLQHSGYPKNAVQPHTLGPIYKTPSSLQVLRFLLLSIKLKIKFHLKTLFQAEIWNVGVGEVLTTDAEKQIPEKINWAPKLKKGKYLADPFWNEDKTAVYAEYYAYKSSKGDIRQITYKEGKWGNVKATNLSGTHYSYPFFTKLNGKSALVPENFESGSLNLYLKEKDRFLKKHELLRGEWIDPTLHQQDGTWYLFATSKKHANSALYLFHASILEGPYTPHPQNPVVVDIHSARPAGPLYRDTTGALIRPAQNSSKTYGGSVVLNEITSLSKTSFAERPIANLVPNPESDFPDGLHTFHFNEGKFLIDGKKLTFVFDSFWFQLKRKINRLLRK